MENIEQITNLVTKKTLKILNTFRVILYGSIG